MSLVGNTGDALTLIVQEVIEIDQNINAIVEAAREQATALQEINAAVNTMDQGTQQNAVMVEETNAASNALVHEVSQITQILGAFDTGEAVDAASRHMRAMDSPPPQGLRLGVARDKVVAVP
ncbi:hypothetical protein D9M72_599510 [compost metagenome]